MENSMVIPQNVKHRITIWFSNSTLKYTPQKIKSSDSNRYLYTQVQSSIIYNHQKVETTQMSINRWMDKQNVLYPYSGILFSFKKEGNSDTCYNGDKPWEHDA